MDWQPKPAIRSLDHDTVGAIQGIGVVWTPGGRVVLRELTLDPTRDYQPQPRT
jgi:hypothetical protein